MSRDCSATATPRVSAVRHGIAAMLGHRPDSMDRTMSLRLLRACSVGLSLAMLAACASSSTRKLADAAMPDTPYLYVLGIAQDGGYPQAGCFKPHCMPGWEHEELRHPVVSLGLVDPLARVKYLFEATPDFPRQYYLLEQEAPAAKYAFGGVFVTHAHIGHYTGLMHFGHEAMGAKDVPVYAMPRMRAFLTDNGPWSQLVKYGNIALKPLEPDVPVALGALAVTPLRVPHRDEYSETVGFVIRGPHKSALFVPDIDAWEKWDRDLIEVLKTVDYALVDATFYNMDELPGRDMSKVPHPLVRHTMALLKDQPASERAKVWFIHMNHGNPLLWADSPQSRAVRSNGFNVAREGLRLPL